MCHKVPNCPTRPRTRHNVPCQEPGRGVNAAALCRCVQRVPPERLTVRPSNDLEGELDVVELAVSRHHGQSSFSVEMLDSSIDATLGQLTVRGPHHFRPQGIHLLQASRRTSARPVRASIRSFQSRHPLPPRARDIQSRDSRIALPSHMSANRQRPSSTSSAHARCQRPCRAGLGERIAVHRSDVRAACCVSSRGGSGHRAVRVASRVRLGNPTSRTVGHQTDAPIITLGAIGESVSVCVGKWRSAARWPRHFRGAWATSLYNRQPASYLR
jgi:hypothetical protein